MSATPFTFNGFYIPARMMPALLRWTQHGELPGEFLQAVIRNDLRDACDRADDENLRNLPAYVNYLYWVAPAGCYGSPEKVAAWAAKFESREPSEPADDEAAMYAAGRDPLADNDHGDPDDVERTF